MPTFTSRVQSPRTSTVFKPYTLRYSSSYITSKSPSKIYNEERSKESQQTKPNLTEPLAVDPAKPPKDISEVRKKLADADEELKIKMARLEGDGGIAGAELEDGKPVAIKRSVKNNMFRIFEFIPPSKPKQ